MDIKLSDVIANLESAQGADQDKRDNAREAETFCEKKNGQWEENVWKRLEGRPRYTFDKVNHIIDLICSSIETKSFGITLSPADIKTDQKLADVVSGIIRQMQYKSKADDIYNRAMRRCIKTGFDAWRVNTRWKKDSFIQEPYLEYIPNAIDRVWFDENSVEPDASDARWCWVLTEMTNDRFKELWPKANISPLGTDREHVEYWYKPEKILVGEYLYKKDKKIKLCMLSNGEVITSENPNYELIKEADPFKSQQRQREEIKCEWYSRKFTASEWLGDAKETVFKSNPVIPVYGNFDVSDGKVIYRGIVERLMDAQRVLNYAASREIEEGALSPRKTYWMTRKMAGGVQDQLNLAKMNTSAAPVHFFDIDPLNPGLVPFQAGSNDINPHLSMLGASMGQHIEAVAGKYGVSLGKNTQLQSGVALDIQNEQASLGDIKWEQVLARAIRRTADVIVEILPEIMDIEQDVQIMSESQNQTIVSVNKRTEEGIENDMANANFSVVVDITEAYNTRQRETVAGFLQVAAIKPEILDTGADILLGNIASPGMAELAARYRLKMVISGQIPPDQLTDEEKDIVAQQAQMPQQPDAMMVAAQAEATKAQADILAQQNKQVELEIQTAKLRQDGYKIGLSEQKQAADIAKTKADTIQSMAKTDQISQQTTKQQIENLEALLPAIDPRLA